MTRIPSPSTTNSSSSSAIMTTTNSSSVDDIDSSSSSSDDVVILEQQQQDDDEQNPPTPLKITTTTTTSHLSSSPSPLLFQTIATHFRTTTSPPLPTPLRLSFYGLYKQSTTPPSSTRPSAFRPIERAKYDAWVQYADLSPDEARRRYIELAVGLEGEVGEEVRSLVRNWREEAMEESVTVSGGVTMVTDDDTPPPRQTPNQTTPLPPPTKYTTPIHPLHPRGHIDIPPRLLLSTLLSPFLSSPPPPSLSSHIVTALSVRTLWDLYLSSKKYPAGSEILMCPGIQIPHMVDICHAHNLKVRGIDVSSDECLEELEVDDIMSAVTDSTCAIMIIYPFGYGMLSSLHLSRLVQKAKERGIDVIEDASECYHCSSQLSKISEVTIRFYSFGTIKTATALGGGVAICANKTLAMEMRRRERMWTVMEEGRFRKKVSWVGLLQFVGGWNWLVGMVYFFCECVGWDYDDLISSSLRMIPPSKNKGRHEQLLCHIRQRLCSSNKWLLHHRISSPTDISHRQRLSQRYSALLSQHCPHVTTPLHHRRHLSSHDDTHWLYPILVSHPQRIQRRMKRYGYDLPRGASQLTALEDCPTAVRLMERVLYLPLSPRLTERDVLGLVASLRECTERVVEGREEEEGRVTTRGGVVFGLLMIVVILCYCRWIRHLCWIITPPVCLLTIVTIIVFYYLHTRYMGPEYLQSKAHLRHQRRLHTNSPSPPLNLSTYLPLPPTTTSSSTVILTGATGFIGQALLRDLLLHRHHLGISHIILLVRSKRNKTPQQRIDDLLSNGNYSFLPPSTLSTMIHVVDCHLHHPLPSSLWELTNVTHVIHCAASVKFTQQMTDAARNIITPALQLQKLSLDLKGQYVHFSTAFVHGGETGEEDKPLGEGGGVALMEGMRVYRSMMEGDGSFCWRVMKERGFPNCYTFAKWVCEQLLLSSPSSLSTIILRPSIVGPALTTPHPGWTNEHPSTLVAAAILYLSYPFNLWSFAPSVVSVIPVDIVCRFSIQKAFFDSKKRVYNIVWDYRSTKNFRWTDYARAVTSVGVHEGYISRGTACVTLYIALHILPRLKLSERRFRYYHRLFVTHPLDALVWWYPKEKRWRLLRSFVDLPVLYHAYMTNTFYFESELMPEEGYDGEEYMMTCLDAAVRYMREREEKGRRRVEESSSTAMMTTTGSKRLHESSDNDTIEPFPTPPKRRIVTIAGRHHSSPSPLLWSLTQPLGNVIIRIAAILLYYILKYTTTRVTVDVTSLQTALTSSEHLILAPNHRSLYDFLLTSFVIFSLPECFDQVQLPHIAAAEEFGRIWFLGWFARGCGAFFLKRGGGREDGSLTESVGGMKGRGVRVWEVFIEGTRSRDRRFVKPKTGFLRCLQKTGGSHTILPITINYEHLPDQTALTTPTTSKSRSPLNLPSTLKWILQIISGKTSIGRIHIDVSPSISLEDDDVKSVVARVQRAQQSRIAVSSFHIRAGAKVLELGEDIIRCAIVGGEGLCRRWPLVEDETEEILDLPTSKAVLWTIMLHYGHCLARYFVKDRPGWAYWLNPSLDVTDEEVLLQRDDNGDETATAAAIRQVVDALSRHFDRAEQVVSDTIKELQNKGFETPTRHHALQYATTITERRRLEMGEEETEEVPYNLLAGAWDIIQSSNNNQGIDEQRRTTSSLSSYSHSSSSLSCNHNNTNATLPSSSSTTITPLYPTTTTNPPSPSPHHQQQSMESFGAWGYTDSKFVIHRPHPITTSPNAHPTVTMTGSRYSFSGKTFPHLLPFFTKEMGLKLTDNDDNNNELQMCLDPIDDVPTAIDSEGLSELKSLFTSHPDAVSIDTIDRYRHGTGHSQQDMCLLRKHDTNFRIPDAVIRPPTESHLPSLIALAHRRRYCIIPIGGGTNVTHATWCPSRSIEPRPIVAVSLLKLNRVIEVNDEDNIAEIQAGMTGGEIMKELGKRGVTMGHIPDSYEFSTLGGWIATRASGMMKNKYGNIEDIVLRVCVCGPKGMVWHSRSNDPFGRVSTGVDVTSLLLGSEGCLGIITRAVVRVRPLPQVRDLFEFVMLPRFEDALDFVREMAVSRDVCPASVRLLDNEQFRLGRSLEADAMTIRESVNRALQTMMTAYHWSSGCFCPESVVGVTIAYEGHPDDIAVQKRFIKCLALRYGGYLAGHDAGKRGYDLTFAIAYLRDFAMTCSNVLGESFETFCPWSKVESLVMRVKERMKEGHRRRCLPGRPFVSCRVSQIYREGVCVYFYLAMSCDGVKDSSGVFASMERECRREILEGGGSMSHHHGVGKLRAEFMECVYEEETMRVIRSFKETYDPENIFGARNGVFGLLNDKSA